MLTATTLLLLGHEDRVNIHRVLLTDEVMTTAATSTTTAQAATLLSSTPHATVRVFVTLKGDEGNGVNKVATRTTVAHPIEVVVSAVGDDAAVGLESACL